MIKIIAVGKLKEKYLVNMMEDYLKRINKYHKIELIEIIDTNPKEEGQKIISKLDSKNYNIALAIDGKEYDSIAFSKMIDEKLMNYGNITFIIGGSNGLSEDVYNKVNERLTFSKLTFPHGLFRGILLEQIYRSFKIINNESYHK